MNVDELRVELARRNISIPELADKIGIGKKSLYQRFKKETQFKQNEILKIKEILHLSNERVMEIFFSPNIS